MKHIVILGAGVGGLSAVFELKELVGNKHTITVVNDLDHFQFTPSNPWVAINWRKREQIQVDIAPILAKRKIEFIHSAAEKLMPESNQIHLANGQVVDYDFLIIATGPKLAFDEIEGLGPEKYSASICKTDHAVSASEEWAEFLKNPGPIVVGAVQGASCFGPAYEYAMILDTDLRKRKIRDQVPITFVTSEPYIGHLGLDGVGDTKSLLESKLRDANINWVTNAKVDKLTKNEVYITEMQRDGTSIEHEPIPFKYSMLLPAFKGIDAIMGIDGLVNPRGFVFTDEYQQNPKFNNIFAIGVCVAIPPLGKTPVPVGVPKTGYMIESMATAAVHNINEIINGNAPSKKPSLNAICLADFGDGGVAFIAKPQIPPRNLNWAASGKWVHLAKVAFEKYFLKKIRRGKTDSFSEKFILDLIGVKKLK